MIPNASIDVDIAPKPIRFRGRTYSSSKAFWEGSQRAMPPAETLQRVLPHLAKLGVTRLANVTGLDRIGIPTVLSVRPRGLSLSVDSGKGFTLEAATASALMESVERHHGETANPPAFRASYDRAASDHAVIPFEQLVRVRAAFFTRQASLSWTLGWNLVDGRDVAAPLMMVRLDKTGDGGPPLPFTSDSNGLAAGNNLVEALTYGLAECIERDAITCWRLPWAAGHPPPRVRLETIENEAALELLGRCERAGVRVVLLDCTMDTVVPVYEAYLYDTSLPHVVLYRGYGAHLDPGIAIVRAITEAVQGRLVYIAGTRDDFFRHVDLRCRVSDDVATVRTIEALPEAIDAGARSPLTTPTFEGDLRFMLACLESVGIRQVIAFDLTQPPFDVAAVRVLVPGLEGPDSESSILGARAHAFDNCAPYKVNHR